MILTRIVPLVFVLFTSFTLWVLATSDEGFWQWFFNLFTEKESLQVVLDLGIAVLLLMYFLYRDHVAQGGNFKSFAPFLIATPLLGVVAPLAYLTLRAIQPQWLTGTEQNPKRI
jgi:ABC-type Na+ efflux pump permease subunit